ncbi:MAG: ABC transporter permease, partial [Lysobacterales bacterium]
MLLWFELRQAWSSLRHSPGYTLACVLILAAGIGLSLFMFAALNGFILKPLPFTDGDRLVHLEVARSEDPGRNDEPTLPDFVDLRREQTVLTDLHAYHEATINLSDGVRPERYNGAFVSGRMFSALGLIPQLGRSFDSDDERIGAPKVVIIGHDVWQNRYGGAADVVGRQVRMNG